MGLEERDGEEGVGRESREDNIEGEEIEGENLIKNFATELYLIPSSGPVEHLLSLHTLINISLLLTITVYLDHVTAPLPQFVVHSET